MSAEEFRDIQTYLPQQLVLEICICIIQEATDQLLILKKINNWPEINTDHFSYKSLGNRFENTIIQDTDFLDIIPRQCGFVTSLFVSLLDEMKNEEAYTNFANVVKTLVRMKFDEENLLKEVAEKEKEVKARQLAIRNEKASFVEKLLNCMSGIGRTKDKIDNFHIESAIKLNYIKSWQNSKLEMENSRFLETFEETYEKINTTDSKIAAELRVHNDFQKVIIEFQEELEEEVDSWKNKYQETLEMMNEKIKILQEKQKKQLEHISQLKALYEKRQQEILEWNTYKAEQEKIRLEKERRNRAATAIEAWWRGTMVRKGFGKFRKKKEKKSKKSSEKTQPKKNKSSS